MKTDVATSWLEAHQAKAADALAHLQPPTEKSEEYKYNAIARLVQATAWTASTPSEIKSSAIPQTDNVLVFVNGFLSEKLSHVQDGIQFKKVSEVERDATVQKYARQLCSVEKNYWAARNAAEANEPYYISIEKNLSSPLYILHFSEEKSSATWVTYFFIHVKKNVQANVVEKFYSNGARTFSNHVSEMVLDENAYVEYYALQQQEHILITDKTIRLSENSHLKSFTGTFSGESVRNNLTILLEGKNSEAHFHGIFLAKGKSVIDNHTTIEHRQPHAQSFENYNGIALDNAKGIFNGKIWVYPQAQKTNAYQLNRNMLLSPDATIHSKPQLEIWADDVKCSHGSATGHVDENALFYLRSRGIAEREAHALLVRAFMQEVIQTIPNDSIREEIENAADDVIRKIRS